MRLTSSQRAYLKNVAAHSGGLYGGKALDLLILGAVTRAVSGKLVGTVFLADAIGGAIYRIADFGLFPVLFRRAAREQVGPTLLRVATLARAAGVAVLTVPFLVVALREFPDQWGIATAFFVFAGIYVVHEVPRAVLAGRERFALTASVGIVTKCVEAVCTVVGLFLGAGIWAWALGRALSQLGMLVGTYRYARQSVATFPSVPAREAFREGLPFWFASAATSALGQIDTIVVGTYLGLVQTEYLGIAGRVTGGVMSFVGSITNVAFPELARKNRRFAAQSHVRAMLTIAVVLCLVPLIGAPLIIRIVTGKFDPGATSVLRAMAPTVAFAAINRGGTTWLQAKNKERAMAAINVAASVLSVLALFVLIPAFGTNGAAFARVLNEVFTLAAFGLLAYITAHRIFGPGAWLVSKLPGGNAFAKNRLDRVTTELGARLLEAPGATHVEVTGSARDPALFRPGVSDIDFVVTSRATGERLTEAVRYCDRVTRAPTFLGGMTTQVVHPDVLAWARRAGHPVLAARWSRVLAGDPIDPPLAPVSAREWALTHAFTLAARVQRDALEDRRDDGTTRSDLIAKDFRYFLARLNPNPAASLRDLRERGFDLPESLAEGIVPAWLGPGLVAEILRATYSALASAFDEASEGWTRTDAAPSPPAWLASMAERTHARAERLATRFQPAAVHLTSTGPTDDDPLLALVVEEWSREQWAEWVHAEFHEPRLALPFRSYRWPLVVAPSVLRADTLIEHAALFHVSRAAARLDVFGQTAPALAPPADVLERAALRETLQALLRIPREAEKAASVSSWRAADVADAPLRGGASRFRVHALVSGRLAALSLLLDHGASPPDREGVTRAYASRYDDSLAAFMTENATETSGARVAAVLDDWACARVERLARLV